jgi:homoserine kinase type II
MGTFRSLSAEDVRAILAGFGLGGYADHRAIAAGTINTNVAVETVSRPLFLRINEGKSLEDVEREGAIVAHVAARGVPTPAPLRTPAGEPFLRWGGTFVSVFPWMAGRTLTRAQIGPGHARETGAALARLHAAGADFPDHRPGRYEPDEIQRRLDGIAGLAGDPVLADAVKILGPALARLHAERTADLPTGLIHGDLFIDNVLYADAGALVALLDFEQASWGRLAYDLAVSVLAFGFGADDFRPDVTRAFIDGYLASARPRPPSAPPSPPSWSSPPAASPSPASPTSTSAATPAPPRQGLPPLPPALRSARASTWRRRRAVGSREIERNLGKSAGPKRPVRCCFRRRHEALPTRTIAVRREVENHVPESLNHDNHR